MFDGLRLGPRLSLGCCVCLRPRRGCLGFCSGFGPRRSPGLGSRGWLRLTSLFRFRSGRPRRGRFGLRMRFSMGVWLYRGSGLGPRRGPGFGSGLCLRRSPLRSSGCRCLWLGPRLSTRRSPRLGPGCGALFCARRSPRSRCGRRSGRSAFPRGSQRPGRDQGVWMPSIGLGKGRPIGPCRRYMRRLVTGRRRVTQVHRCLLVGGGLMANTVGTAAEGDVTRI